MRVRKLRPGGAKGSWGESLPWRCAAGGPGHSVNKWQYHHPTRLPCHCPPRISHTPPALCSQGKHSSGSISHVWGRPVVPGPAASPGAGLVTPMSHLLHSITHYPSLHPQPLASIQGVDQLQARWNPTPGVLEGYPEDACGHPWGWVGSDRF